MSELRVASRYVKSLISLAQEQGVLEEVHEDMKLFSGICVENREFTLMLKSPIIRKETKSNILKVLFEGKVHQVTNAFFAIIVRKNREKLLSAIADEFKNQYNQLKEIGMAKVTTVFPLDESLRDEFIRLVLEFTSKRTVELEEATDEDLVGGFVLRLGDRQMDESLRGKLKELKLKFS